MIVDFTLQQYEALCLTLLESDYLPLTIGQYLDNQQTHENIVIMRHDVDRRPMNALRMARLENRLGLHSTYYFRYTRQVFKPSIIKEIYGLGHEIGYHYETLSKARGDYKRAIDLFKRELEQFRALADIQTISMHGSPLSPFDNRDLWLKYDYHDFKILGEAYLSINYKEIQYLTDTGRTWNRTFYNLRDHTSEMRTETFIKSTCDLILAIREKRFPSLCISSHPERWSTDFTEWSLSLVSDLTANLAKATIRFVSRQSLKRL